MYGICMVLCMVFALIHAFNGLGLLISVILNEHVLITCTITVSKFMILVVSNQTAITCTSSVVRGHC